jgi:hypothetical protein
MVKRSVGPGIKLMTAPALGGELERLMVKGAGREIFFQVAGRATRVKPPVLRFRPAAVARIAVGRRMSAGEWETILVVLYGLHGYFPATHGMTLVAFPSELTSVNVRVAIGALPPHRVEDELDVALAAIHRLVETSKRIGGLLVAEVRPRTDGSPTRGCMAVLTGNRESSVRAKCTASLRLG